MPEHLANRYAPPGIIRWWEQGEARWPRTLADPAVTALSPQEGFLGLLEHPGGHSTLSAILPLHCLPHQRLTSDLRPYSSNSSALLRASSQVTSECPERRERRAGLSLLLVNECRATKRAKTYFQIPSRRTCRGHLDRT